MVALNSSNIPPDHILAWCRRHVAMIADGGVWGIPRSGIAFRVDHKNKRLVLTVGRESDDDFQATKHVFSFIGWTVVAEGENNNAKTGPV